MRDVDPEFGEDGNGFRVNVAGGLRARAENLQQIARGVAEEAFGQVTAAGIPGAEDEDARF